MPGTRMRIAAAGVGVLLVAGAAVAAGGSGGAATAQPDRDEAPTATSEVVRRTIQSSDELDGTLGYTGAYTVTNALATSSGDATAAGQSPTEVYLAAKAQYDAAVAGRNALRNPTAADVRRAEATLAQARASLKTAKLADDGPTAAQRANARAAVAQAEQNLALAIAQRDAADSALAACPEATEASVPATCDRAALEAALDRARGEASVKRAQVKAAKATLAGLGDTPANAAAGIASAQASVNAAAAALDALLHPTRAKLRQADNSVVVAKAQLDEAALALARPSGTVTWIPEAGAVVEAGGLLYALDGTHAVALLTGEVPAWRGLGPGVPDGPDVGQLERSLETLGFGFAETEPDDHWDEDTTAAVEAFQASLGVAADGSLDLGEVVFLPTAVRVTAVLSDLGSTIKQGSPVVAASSTDREVGIELEADRQAIVSVGAGVTVGLPDGTEAAGTIADVGTVATVAAGAGASDEAEPTVTVTVHLDDPGVSGSLDGAPVTVRIVRERREDVLAVPVGALLALAEGGYAVEVVDGPGQNRLVGVEIGLFEDGFVEVRSPELEAGLRVVVPS